jgi:hypothetical protein
VFSAALLTTEDLPIEWQSTDAPDNETLQTLGAEICANIGARSSSALAGFIVGAPSVETPLVIHRVYEYPVEQAVLIIRETRGCASRGTIRSLSLPALGDESVAAQVETTDPASGEPRYVEAAIIRRTNFLAVVIYAQNERPVEPSQIELFAREADRKLEAAIQRAPEITATPQP